MFSYATLSWDRAPFSLGGRFCVTWHPASAASGAIGAASKALGRSSQGESSIARAAFDLKRTP